MKEPETSLFVMVGMEEISTVDGRRQYSCGTTPEDYSC